MHLILKFSDLTKRTQVVENVSVPTLKTKRLLHLVKNNKVWLPYLQSVMEQVPSLLLLKLYPVLGLYPVNCKSVSLVVAPKTDFVDTSP